MAGNAGPVRIQGCAIRISRLNSDGSISAASTSGMIVDDKPFVKFSAKPNVLTGVEMVPTDACGNPLISYKDYDRIKRWDATLDLGDEDFEKREMIGGGSLLTAASSSGRTFADGVTVSGSTEITSPALGAFVATDVGRAVTGTGVGVGAIVTHLNSATSVTVSVASTASASGVSITLGAIASRTVGYSWPALLTPANPYGVALEIWSKAIVRGTGYQGTTPYPSVGSVTPALPSSAWIRFGAFRFIPSPQDVTIEDKEGMQTYAGWCLENPLFGLGPMKDWTTAGVAGSGTAVDTTKVFAALMDSAIPSTRQAGYQTTAA